MHTRQSQWVWYKNACCAFLTEYPRVLFKFRRCLERPWQLSLYHVPYLISLINSWNWKRLNYNMVSVAVAMVMVIITLRRNYSESYFLQNRTRILIWIIIDFIKNDRHIIYKTDYSNYFQFKHICIHILWRMSDTGIIMMSQRRCYARDLQNLA